MNLKISPKKQFFISSLIVFSLLTVFLGYLVDFEIKQFTIKHLEEETDQHVKENATSILPRTVFTKPDFSRNKGTFEEFTKTISYMKPERIKIYNSTGVIVYSDLSELVGKKYDDEELDTALNGNVTGHIDTANSEEHATEKSLGSFMEAYVPIFYDNYSAPSGVIEVYF